MSRSDSLTGNSGQTSQAEPPSTPKGHKPRRSITFVSPINLPVGTNDDARSNKSSRGSPVATISPKRSFYMENAVPVSDETPVHRSPMLTRHASTNGNADQDLIFDDGDEALPPTVPSPTIRKTLQQSPDIMAISSPQYSPGAQKDLNEQGLDDTIEFSHDALTNDSASITSIRPEDSISLAGERASPYMSPSMHHNFSLSVGGASYPAPVPAMLLRPPKLSKRSHRNHDKTAIPPDELPSPPKWGPSPLELEQGVQFLRPEQDPHFTNGNGEFDNNSDDEVVSDVDSDRATIMSDDRADFDNASVLDGGALPATNAKSKHRRNWLSAMFGKKSYKELGSKRDEMGEKYDHAESEMLQGQQAQASLESELAFLRLDPEAVQRHSQMFNAGGLHSSVAPRKEGPTSLIEELEIRKAGRKVQRQVFFREINEIERQRAEDAAATDSFHPVDLLQPQQPTLMQMQYMADVDYQARVDWHKRAINQPYIQDGANETLAERRARLKAEKMRKATIASGNPDTPAAAAVAAAAADPPRQETLAERRQRLKKQRQLSAIKPVDAQSISSSIYPEETAISI